MTTQDLSGLNLAQLRALLDDIAKAITVRQRSEMQTAREKILEIAREAGIALEDLLSTKTPKASKGKTSSARPQYQNPTDATITWSGRGRQPKWITEGLASGKTLDEFRIQ